MTLRPGRDRATQHDPGLFDHPLSCTDGRHPRPKYPHHYPPQLCYRGHAAIVHATSLYEFANGGRPSVGGLPSSAAVGLAAVNEVERLASELRIVIVAVVVAAILGHLMR